MRRLFGWYLFLWALTILPIFLLGAGFAGSFGSALRSWISVAADGDTGAALMLIASVPVLATPFWLWSLSRHRGRRSSKDA